MIDTINCLLPKELSGTTIDNHFAVLELKVVISLRLSLYSISDGLLFSLFLFKMCEGSLDCSID